MLPFFILFLLHLLILPVASCLINFLSRFFQQQMQKISNQTFKQLLLQDHQPLVTEPEESDSWLYPDCEDQVKIVKTVKIDTLIQQEAG